VENGFQKRFGKCINPGSGGRGAEEGRGTDEKKNLEEDRL